MTKMLKPIKSRQIWEKFVLKYSPQALFQSWPWGEVQQKLGVPVWRLGIYVDNKLVGVAQAVLVNAKRGKFLHIRHGPIFSEDKPEIWQTGLTELKRLAQKEKVWFLRISPLIFPENKLRIKLNELGFKSAPIHAMDAELCWILDLDKSPEELLQGMRKTTRYEIRQAQKMGVEVIKSENPDDLKHFFKLYAQTSGRHNFVQHKGIQEEFEIFGKEKQALLFLGKCENQVLAAAIIIFYGGQAIYHHGASVSSKVPISYLIQWEAILEAKKRGIKLYNFWGIAPENKLNHPWRGLTLFKIGFGGRQIEYLHALDLPLSPLYHFTGAIEAWQRVKRGY